MCGKGQAASRADSKKMSPNSFAFRDGDLFGEWRYAEHKSHKSSPSGAKNQWMDLISKGTRSYRMDKPYTVI